MGIGTGMDASIAYERITCGNATQKEIVTVRTELIKYCGLDTEGMIWIVEKLRDLCRWLHKIRLLVKTGRFVTRLNNFTIDVVYFFKFGKYT